MEVDRGSEQRSGPGVAEPHQGVIVMRIFSSRLVRAVGAGSAVMAVVGALALAPVAAEARGYRGGGHGGGWGWGWGLGLGLGVGLAADSLLGWPGYYYPYGPYAYPYPAYPTTVIQQVPVAVPAAPASYYYCDNPKGYYPYVASCQTPWRPVPAAPPAQ